MHVHNGQGGNNALSKERIAPAVLLIFSRGTFLLLFAIKRSDVLCPVINVARRS